MITFERLESRYIFTGTLVLAQAMHLGSGEGNEQTDSLFTRSNGKFYIPGSSLRGALRSTVERIAYTLELHPEKAKNVSCLLSQHSGSKCISVCKETQTQYKNLSERPGTNEGDLKKILEKDGYLCDTCKVFGSTHLASRVKITDLYPVDCNPQGVIRRNVGIDRDTETASQTALFDMQVVEGGSIFDFELIVENLDEVEWGLLCIGLWEMIRKQEDGGAFYIGAKSAAGLGKCHLDNLKIQYFKGACGLKKYLESGKMPNTKEGCEAVNFVKGKVQAYLNPEEDGNAKTNG